MARGWFGDSAGHAAAARGSKSGVRVRPKKGGIGKAMAKIAKGAARGKTAAARRALVGKVRKLPGGGLRIKPVGKATIRKLPGGGYRRTPGSF